MISKERLEELIRQGATIYDIFQGDIWLVDLTMTKYYDVPKYIEYKNNYYKCNLTRSNQDLFETQEEAEFALKYQNITRTETLSLPTWEEIENDYIEPNIILFHRFMKKDNTEAELVVDCFDNKIEVLGVGGAYNIWEATKENYLEACELCRKLFLDEIEGETK